jgi:hypothetical protein
MHNIKQRQPTNRADAQRQGTIDGKEWAETKAHHSELSQIGYWYRVNRHLRIGTSFHYRGPLTGAQGFVEMIRPYLDDKELRDAAREFWSDRQEVIDGFGPFGLHYLKEFSDAALCVWLPNEESWEAVTYTRGVEAGQRWSKTNAAPEELERLRRGNEAHWRAYGGRLCVPKFDDPYEIAKTALAPEPYGDDEDDDPEVKARLKKRFWEPIIGQPYELHRYKISERRFIIGFVDGALDKTDQIWSKF